MRPGGPSIGVFNASFALTVRTVRTSVRYRKPCLQGTCSFTLLLHLPSHSTGTVGAFHVSPSADSTLLSGLNPFDGSVNKKGASILTLLL